MAQQSGDVSLVERQIEVMDGVPPPIAFGQAMKGYAHWHGRELAVLVRRVNSISYGGKGTMNMDVRRVD